MSGRVALGPFEVVQVSFGSHDRMFADSFYQNITDDIRKVGFQGFKTEQIQYSRSLTPTTLEGKRVLAIWTPNASFLPPYEDLMQKCKKVGAVFLLNVASHNINESQFSAFQGKYCLNGEVNDVVRQWIRQSTPLEQDDTFNNAEFMRSFKPVPSAQGQRIKRICYLVLRFFAAIFPSFFKPCLDRLFTPFEVVLVRDSDHDLREAEKFLESKGIWNPKIEEITVKEALNSNFSGKRVLMICPSGVSATQLDFEGTASDAIQKKCMDDSAKFLYLHQGHWNPQVVSNFVQQLNLFASHGPAEYKNYFDTVIEHWKQLMQV